MEQETTTNDGSRAFRILFLAVLIDLLGFGIIIPILPFLAQDIDPAREGVILATLLAVYSLAQFVFSPIWGRISDRYGRRPIILLGLFGSSIGFTLFGLFTSYTMLLLSRAIAGFFTGATLPTARAYIADITPPEEKAKRFGLLGAAFGIGFTFGPAIGSLLSLDFFMISGLPQQAAASFFAALLCLVNFILAYRRLPETINVEDAKLTQRKSISESVSSFFSFFSFPGIAILILVFGITTLMFSGFESMFALFANEVDDRITQDNIGYYFAFIGILVAVFQSSLVGPTVDRFGEELTIIIGLSFQVIGFYLITLATGVFTLIFYVIPLGIGSALVNPTISSAISNRIPHDQQGGGLGINSSVGSLARVIGPLYGGYLYDNVSPASPFEIGAVAVLLVLILTYLTLYRSQTEPVTSPEQANRINLSSD